MPGPSVRGRAGVRLGQGGSLRKLSLFAASKRCLDIVGALTLLAVLAPVMLLAVLAIKLESRGPVLYRQERVGLRGQLFTVTKFRSMRVDAESGGVPVWATAKDPRVTRTGRWMRKTRIDELPQLVAVLRGAMSLVGPRPERAFFVDQLRKKLPGYDLRHEVRPGLTGLAQVKHHYSASVDDAIEKLRFDLAYVENQSLALDLRILLETVAVVLTGRGAR